MLEEVAIGPVLTTQAALQGGAPVVAASTAGSGGGSAGNSAAAVSPSPELNAQIGIVVIQYRDQSGEVQFTIPSRQQLDAYAASAAGTKGVGGDDSTTA
jgi:hypothetical protein